MLHFIVQTVALDSNTRGLMHSCLPFIERSLYINGALMSQFFAGFFFDSAGVWKWVGLSLLKGNTHTLCFNSETGRCIPHVSCQTWEEARILRSLLKRSVVTCSAGQYFRLLSVWQWNSWGRTTMYHLVYSLSLNVNRQRFGRRESREAGKAVTKM